MEDRTLYRVPVGRSPVRGPANALVTVVEFADFQCGFCVRVEDTLRALRTRYGDEVRMVWKHQPLPFHKRAEPAAELAIEAHAQKGDAGFWMVHDLLLEQHGQLEDNDLENIARTAGLNVAATMRAVHEGKHEAAVDEDLELADDLNAKGTPTFFINGRKLVGAQPIAEFVTVIDEQLAAARTAARTVTPAKVYEALQQTAVPIVLERVRVPAPTVAHPSQGSTDAKVVVQMWSDLECPFCKQVEPTLAELEAAFPGQLRLVWHHHPLPFHRHAMLAAVATMEARAQQGDAGFWKMHDFLLQGQDAGHLERTAIERHAGEQGLDLMRFRAALDGTAHRAAIEADVATAMSAGLAGTPNFVINGYKLSGAQPLSKFKKVIQRVLAEAR